MSTDSDARDRLVIPRWRSLSNTIATGELRSTRSRDSSPIDGADDLRTLENDWLLNQSHSFASDFVGVAQTVGAWGVANDAAEFLLVDEGASSAQKVLARRYLDAPDSYSAQLAPTTSGAVESEVREGIVSSRFHLNRDPRNAIAWTELARGHAILGRLDRARQEMSTAVQLAPINRFVLRAAVALFVHAEEPDRAHGLLVAASNVRSDPWLLAAELSTSEAAGRRSRLTKTAAALLQSDIPPQHVTELASALGTLELRAGNAKRAKTLLRASLESANDNSIAQAEWASHRLQGISPPTDALESPLAFEARARREVEVGEWKAAVQNAWSWLYDQPFTAAAAIFGSHAASVGLRDFAEAVRFAEAGLVASPNDPMLLNNYAFALLQLGRSGLAAEVLRRISMKGLEARVAAVVTATQGLLQFRLGRPDEGRRLYREAITAAKRLGSRDIAGVGELMLAREELRVRGSEAIADVLRAIHSVENDPNVVVRGWVAFLTEEVAGWRA